MHIDDTQRLVTEIEMLKVVFYLVNRKRGRGDFIRSRKRETEKKKKR